MIAWLSGHETRWERKAALGIEGEYHEWDYPTGSSLVNQLEPAGITENPKHGAATGIESVGGRLSGRN